MNITKMKKENTLFLVLEGRLDTTTAPQFQEVFIPEIDQEKYICLDCRDLVYVSSAGLRIILLGEKIAQEKSCEITLTNVSEEILEVLEMTGFSEILRVE